jgi:hypothetical protein
MIVGNIVNCNEEVDKRYFNCLSISDFLATEHFDNHTIKGLPTLIVGWEVVKEHYSGVNILSKMVYPPKDGFGGLYWTFSKQEKRGIYELNLKEFKERCYIDLVKGITTYNIDPIIYKIHDTEQLCTRLVNLASGTGYLFQESTIYIYKDNNIYMIDLELIDFIDFDRELVIKTLKDNLKIFGDDFEEKFTEELKHLGIKYTPYLEYKNATENTITSLIRK